jgi:hypothetical protein
MRWGKHLMTARNDEKMVLLRETYGAEGYGIYWMIFEMVGEKATSSCTKVEFPESFWRKSLGVSAQKFRVFADFFKNSKLFLVEKVGNMVSFDCPNILKYCDEYTERSIKKSGQSPDIVGTKSDPRARVNPEIEKEREREEEPEREPEEENRPEEEEAPPTPQGGESDGPPETKAHSGNTKSDLKAAINSYTGDPALRQALEDFRAMRERIRKPMTGKALDLILAKLDGLARDGPGKIAVLEQSVLNSWQGVFSIRPGNDNGTSRLSGKEQRTINAVNSWIERQHE